MFSSSVEAFLGRIPQDYCDLLHDFLSNEKNLPYLEQLVLQENEARLQFPDEIFPKKESVFKALHQTPAKEVKVVLLGQDPYHSPGLAQGLAFSIPEHIPTNSRAYPSSLRNISKALFLDGFDTLPHGDLSFWAEQGVLLLNTCLTVRQGEAHSHQHWGWDMLTNAIIQELSKNRPLIWMLWGKVAQKKAELIAPIQEHLILQASHPSGLGAYQTNEPFLLKGDVGSCGHFKQANQWLIQHSTAPIVWSSSVF
jgi:uracil-DNA glycosylase